MLSLARAVVRRQRLVRMASTGAKKAGGLVVTSGHRTSRTGKEVSFLHGLEVMFLGTSAGGPQAGRGNTSIALRFTGHSQGGSHLWLFDCGEGSHRQVLNSNLPHAGISRIFVTHMHGDHIWGLASAVLSALLDTGSRDPEVCVYGPSGLYAYLCCSLEVSRTQLKKNFRIKVFEFEDDSKRPDNWKTSRWDEVAFHERIQRFKLKPDLLTQTSTAKPLRRTIEEDATEWLVFEDDFCTVRAGRLRHAVACFGYVVTEKSSKLKIDVERAKARGIAPGPDYRKFQNNEDVRRQDGTVVRASEVTTPPSPPRKIAIFGDTSGPSKALTKLAMNADLLIHEATFADNLMDIALKRGHSTPTMAGTFAKKVNAEWLALTHFSPRFVSPHAAYKAAINGGPDLDDQLTVNMLVKSAKRAFQSPNVLAASDFMTLHVPKQPPPIQDNNVEQAPELSQTPEPQAPEEPQQQDQQQQQPQKIRRLPTKLIDDETKQTEEVDFLDDKRQMKNTTSS